jgi:hypothetical protein
MPIINTFRFPEKNEPFRLGSITLVGTIPSYQGLTTVFTVPHPTYKGLSTSGSGFDHDLNGKLFNNEYFYTNPNNNLVTSIAIISWYTDEALTNKVNFPFTEYTQGINKLYPKWNNTGIGGTNKGYKINTEFNTFELNAEGANFDTFASNSSSGISGVIHNEINGKPVTRIANDAFNNESVTTIIQALSIPDTITYIGDRAFSERRTRGNLVIPSSVQYIGEKAFYRNQLSSIVIPNGLVIKPETFRGYINSEASQFLTSITLGEGVVFEKNNLIFNTRNLTDITVGSGSVLKEYSFTLYGAPPQVYDWVDNQRTMNLDFGESITFETDSFRDFFRTTLTVSNSQNTDKIIDFRNIMKSNSTLHTNAFRGNNRLYIGYDEFGSELRTKNRVQIPNWNLEEGSLSQIGFRAEVNAWPNYPGIPTITAQQNSTWLFIGQNQYGNKNPGFNTLTGGYYINVSIFGAQDNIKDTVNLFANKGIPFFHLGTSISHIPENFLKNSKIGYFLTDNVLSLSSFLTATANLDFSGMNNLVKIDKGAFTDLFISSAPAEGIDVKFNETLREIGEYNTNSFFYNVGAFAYTTIDPVSNLNKIKSIELENLNNLEIIGDYSFPIASSNSLAAYARELPTLPSNLKKIGVGAFAVSTSSSASTENFYYKTGEFLIPKSVTHIGQYAFQGTNAQNIRFESRSEGDSPLEYVAPWSFADISRTINMELILFPNNKIPDNFAQNCFKLKSIIIPDGTTDIGYYSFYRCREIEEIVIPSSISKIENFAFSDDGTNFFSRVMKIYAAEAPIASASSIAFNQVSGRTQTIQVPVGATGYNQAPWTNYTVQYVL